MPERRAHRGPAPPDRELFAPDRVARLREAVADLSWLLTRGYAEESSLKLVGDRLQLTARQRVAVRRSASAAQALAARCGREVAAGAVRGRALLLDGFNVLTTVEAALAGGVILVGRDGCLRDLASLHGTYRRVAETEPAIRLLGAKLGELEPRSCLWLLDRPVSNSGRLKTLILGVAREAGWPWECELVWSPDRTLAGSEEIVATADHAILDRCRGWFNLSRAVVEAGVPGAWMIDLSETAAGM